MCSLDALAGDSCRVQALGCAVGGGRHPGGLAKFLPIIVSCDGLLRAVYGSWCVFWFVNTQDLVINRGI